MRATHNTNHILISDIKHHYHLRIFAWLAKLFMKAELSKISLKNSFKSSVKHSYKVDDCTLTSVISSYTCKTICLLIPRGCT